MKEIIVDNFAGGGGASTGIEAALGRPIDFAINHDPEAIAMHRANHPSTKHFVSSVWDVSPARLAAGRPVGLGWFSPDCTFHSKARGGKPFRDRDVARRRRGLAGLIPRWAATAAAPRVIMLENVEEFADWGPLLPDGRICPRRRGMLFRRWHRQLENLGYRIDMRELRACDYGSPTSRKRLFIVMRRDRGDIIFPAASHGIWTGAQPYRTAADCIDWSIPCPSIFTRERPLAEATLRRIARGVMRYVVNSQRPFIVPITHSGGDRVHSIDEPLRTVTTAQRGEFALIAPHITKFRTGATGSELNKPMPTVTANSYVKRPGGAAPLGLVTAFLAQHNGGRNGHQSYGHDARKPMSTIAGNVNKAIVTSHLVKMRGDNIGQAATEPLQTVSAQGNHFGEVRAFLLRYNGQSGPQPLSEPISTIDTTDRFSLVMVHGEPYQIVDIGMRMLTPRELFRAQGFRDSYIIEYGIDEFGECVPLTKTAQVRMCGNSVNPDIAEALVNANVVQQREGVAA